MGKIRVAQLINAFIPCGAENVARDLALHLDRDRFESIVIAVRRIKEYAQQEDIFQKELEQKGIRSYCLGKRPGSYSLLPFLRLVRILRKERPDILHMHGQLPQLLGLTASLFSGRPKTAITIHSAVKYVKPIFKYIVKGLLIPLHKPDIVSVSSTIDGKFKFFRAEKRLIHNGIDISHFPVRKNGNPKNKRKVIGVVGRFSEAKGHHILFDAVMELLKRRDDFVLYLVGDGELKDHLMRMARENRLNDHVQFLGFRDDVKDLYQTFDLVVIPSLWEGLSLTLLEAMASGLPVVATSVSGNIDVIDDGRTGLLVPPNSPCHLAQAIDFMLDHPEKAALYGRSARRVIEQRFSVQTMVRKYDSLYSRVGHP